MAKDHDPASRGRMRDGARTEGEIGLFEFFEKDPIKADREFFGRESSPR